MTTLNSTTYVRSKPYVDIRCRRCNKLLFRWKFQGNASVESRCPRCSHTEVVTLST